MASSPISKDPEYFYISPAELQVFMKHYDESHRVDDYAKVIRKARGALGSSIPAEFVASELKAFRKFEQQLLGDHAILTTFKKQMGIVEVSEPVKGEWQFDLVSYKTLLSPWIGKPQEEVNGFFLQLEPYEQKLLLKALAHFSKSHTTLRAGIDGLTQKDLMILQSLVSKLQKISGSGSLPRDVKKSSYQLYLRLYPLYKSGGSIELGQKNPSVFKKRELFQIGEKRIGGELKNDFRHLFGALSNLQSRFEKKDPKFSEDLLFYFHACRLAIAKGEAQMDLHYPYTSDPDVAVLQAKAMANVAELHSLEAVALSMMEQMDLISPLEEGRTVKASFLKVDYLLETARQLVDRPDVANHLKAGVLRAKLILMRAGDKLTKNDFDLAVKGLQKGVAWGDQESIIEKAKLTSCAWKAGIEGVKEEDTLNLLKPLGKMGAHALRDHFRAGSKAAGLELIALMKNRLNPPPPNEKLHRLWQSIIDLFYFGPERLVSEERFMCKDPHRFSKSEIDFLIEASLLGLKEAQDLIDQSVKGDFGPKIPLEQAQSFLGKFQLLQDTDMIVNGQKAYRYLQTVAETVLSSRWPPDTIVPLLNGYLDRVCGKETEAIETLEPLYQQLTKEK